MVHEVGNKKSSTKKMPKPPDGGWGWWVVAASFLVHVIADGVAYTFGLFFVQISEDLKESKSATSWIASIMAGVTYGSGPIAGALVNRYGCRVVSVAGSIIASFGFAISFFADSVLFLYFSVGIVGGIGLGLIYLPAIVSVTTYFEKKRAFATGIAVCGSGFGTFCLAPLIQWLITTYMWRGAFIYTGGIILLCAIFSCFFRPLKDNEEVQIVTTVVNDVDAELDEPLMISKTTSSSPNHTNSLQKLRSESNSASKNFLSLDNQTVNETLTMSYSQPVLRAGGGSIESLNKMEYRNGKRHSLKFGSTGIDLSGARKRKSGHASDASSPLGLIMERKDIFYSGSLLKLPYSQPDVESSVLAFDVGDRSVDNTSENKCCSCCSPQFRQVMKTMMDFSILRDPIFLFFAFSNFFTSIGYNVPYVYLVDMAVGSPENPINSLEQASFLLSIVGISNTFSRIILGYLSDKQWVNRLYLYNGALTLCGLATGICSHTNDINMLRLYAAVFGSTVGVYVSLTSVILVDLLGLDRLTNAFGLLLLFQGVATVIGPPIVGKLFDVFQSYIYGFWLAGGMIAISGLMLFFIPLIQRMEAQKDLKKQQSNNNKDSKPNHQINHTEESISIDEDNSYNNIRDV